MAEVIRMPLLSDTMTEGKIVKWNKSVGDTVKSDDVLADVETDKATMEVVGYADGTLLYIGFKEGEAAKVNEIIAIVGKPGEDIQQHLSAAAPAATVAPAPAALVSLSLASKLKNSILSIPTQEFEAPVSRINLPATPLIFASSSMWFVTIFFRGIFIYFFLYNSFFRPLI